MTSQRRPVKPAWPSITCFSCLKSGKIGVLAFFLLLAVKNLLAIHEAF